MQKSRDLSAREVRFYVLLHFLCFCPHTLQLLGAGADSSSLVLMRLVASPAGYWEDSARFRIFTCNWRTTQYLCIWRMVLQLGELSLTATSSKGIREISLFSFLFFVSSIIFCKSPTSQNYLKSNLLVWGKQLCQVLQANHQNILNFPYVCYWLFKIPGLFSSFSSYS